jgi:outer membrane protein
MNRALIIATLPVLGLGTATPASAETIHDAIAAAYAGNPALAAARARQEALGETVEQARAGGRLTASLDAEGGYNRFDYGSGGGATVTADLPVWTGGRVRSAVRAAQGDVAAGAEGLRDTEASVLEAVVTAFADLLYDQQAVEIAQADIALLDNQVADARARFRLGNATRTDVARLEAQRAAAGATLAAGQAALAVDAARYRARVGHEPGTLTQAPAAPTALPGTLDQARERALAANPLYQQSQRAIDAGNARVEQARANGRPTVSLDGAYGYDANLSAANDRTFPRASSGGVTLRIPILTGGLVHSQVRQAQATLSAARFDSDEAGREAILATDTAWAALGSARAQGEANALSLQAADLALKGVRAEYVFGLRSTLDILVADESLRSAQLSLARNQSDMIIAQAALLHATGMLNRDAY